MMLKTTGHDGLSELDRLTADAQMAGAAARMADGTGRRAGWIIDARLHAADLRATARRAGS